MRLAEINNVVISGRMTQDPRYSMTQNGKGVLISSVAVNKRYLDTQTQTWKDDAVFVPVVVWGDAATRLKDKCRKGTPVVVEGRLTSSEYTGKDGKTIRTLQITANRMQVLEAVEPTSVSTEPVVGDLDDDEAMF